MSIYKVKWNDEEEEYEVSNPTGCFIPSGLIWWILIALAGLALGSGESEDHYNQMGGYTCYDSIIWGEYCG